MIHRLLSNAFWRSAWFTLRSFLVLIATPCFANTAPTIVTEAVTEATQDTLYSYRVLAVDENGDSLVWSVKNVAALPDWLSFQSTDYTVTTIAGQAGKSGKTDGPSNVATFNEPIGIAVDALGNLYVADSGNHMVRKISPTGQVTTVAGTGKAGKLDDSNARNASFYDLRGVTVNDEGVLFVADTANHTIRRIATDGSVSTFAGAGVRGRQDAKGNLASFRFPRRTVFDSQGNLFVADASNHLIRKILPDGTVSTFAGSGLKGSDDDDIGINAKFNIPRGIAIDSQDNLYIADTENHKIRKITPSGKVTTLAGKGTKEKLDGKGLAAAFDAPIGIAVDGNDIIYVADANNHAIRRITPDGVVSTIAGQSRKKGSEDGAGGSEAMFNIPIGLTVDDNGNLYVADYGNELIRKVTPPVTTLVGTPTNSDVGDHNVCLVVSDNTDSVEHCFTITVANVNDAPSSAGNRVTVDEDLSYTFLVNDFAFNDIDAKDSLSMLRIDTLPSAGTLTLDGNKVAANVQVTAAQLSNGSLVFTPVANENGAAYASFDYSVNDGTAYSTASSTLTIDVNAINDPPVTLSTAVTVAVENSQYSYVFSASDVDEADNLTLVAKVLPGWLSFDAVTGRLSGTPGNDDVGSHQVVLVATDSVNTATQEFTLEVVNTNDAPVLSGTPPTTVKQDDSYAFTPTASDVDVGDTLTFSIANRPAWATFDTATGALTGTPVNDDVGVTQSIAISVTDGTETLSLPAFDLTVENVNDAPVGADDAYTLAEGGTLTGVNVLVNDLDVDGDVLSAQLVAAPSHGTVTLAADGSVDYQHDGSETVSDSFTYRATDGGLTSEVQTVSLTVTPVNNLPVAVDDTVVVKEGALLQAPSVLLNDVDPDSANLMVEWLSDPDHGEVTYYDDGSFDYQHDGSETTTDRLTYRVSDGLGDSETATVTLTIKPVNDQPIALDVAFPSDEDGALVLTLEGTDAEGSALSYKVIRAPAHGTLSGEGAKREYLPDENYVGTDTFEFVVNDGEKDSEVATVTVIVGGTNDRPVANDDAFEVDEGKSISGSVLGNDEDVDGDRLTVELVGIASHGQLTLQEDGQFQYVHDGSETLEDRFTYRVSDGVLRSQLATVVLTVVPQNDRPVSENQSYSTDEDTLLAIELVGKDVDDTALQFTIASEPENGTLSLVNGVGTYQPALNFEGIDQFTYRVSDGELRSELATVVINVNGVNDIPVAQNQQLATPEDVPLALRLRGSDADRDTLRFAIATAPQRGTLTVDGTRVTYVPDANFNGEDRFTYVANDGTDGSADATVVIDVVSVNDAPTASSQSLETNQEEPLQVTLTGSDIESSELRFEVFTPPQHGTLSGTAPELTYTPDADYVGDDELLFVSDDGELRSAPTRVSIRVRRDTDGDGIPDDEDDDDDNDGVPDEDDAFPQDAGESTDADGDGVGDNRDADDDNDSVLDINDAYPLVAIGNLTDTDGDGAPDTCDDACVALGMAADSDDDNDGVLDINDAYPLVAIGSLTDTDGDGAPNECDEACQQLGMAADSDDDNDGVLDITDAYPLVAIGSLTDTDGDGAPDACDDACVALGMVADSDDDNDSVADAQDAFPRDPDEDTDTDGDGIGDNRDDDDDNDGVPDGQDAFPSDPSRNSIPDFDGDNLLDVFDLDDDNDGVLDVDDAFPFDPSESRDTDGDGIGDNRDSDDDNDGVADVDDAFPRDPSENQDQDMDGIGDNQDSDDNNDGIDDTVSVDYDGDGIVDNQDSDIDGDGVPNEFDQFPFNPNEFLDTDVDGIGNNQDTDDDNDGIADAEDRDANGNGINDANEAPTLLVPPAIEVDAVALMTRVDLGVSIAYDVEGERLPTSLLDGQTFFPPGRNVARWQAVGDNGEIANVVQEVVVHPRVSLPKEQQVTEGGDVRFTVMLNGESPSYPLEVPYTVSGSANSSDHDLVSGVATIDSGLSVEVSFSVFDDGVVEDEERIVVTLGDEVNRGTHFVHEIRVIEGNVAPQVELVSRQGGERRRLIDPLLDSSLIDVEAVVIDANVEDTHEYRWSINGEEVATGSNVLRVDPISDDTENGVIRVSVLVRDDSGMGNDLTQASIDIRLIETNALSANEDSDGDGLSDAEEGFKDSDGDGVPDYLDSISFGGNVIQQDSQDGQRRYLVEADAGTSIGLGRQRLSTDGDGVLIAEQELAEVVGASNEDVMYFNSGGAFDFVVRNLATAGQSVSVAVPLRQAIPSNAVYRKYHPDTGKWFTFVEDESNGIRSAPGVPGFCPSPGSEEWRDGLNEGDWCVELTIEDGGPNDADDMANNEVVDPGGVAVEQTLNQAPVAKDDQVSVTENKTTVIDVLSNDSDPDNDELKIISASVESGIIEIFEGQLRYSPSASFVGFDQGTYSVSDGMGGVISADIVLEIKPNTPPIVGEIVPLVADIEKPVVIDVLGYLDDIDNDVLIVESARANFGTVSLPEDKERTTIAWMFDTTLIDRFLIQPPVKALTVGKAVAPEYKKNRSSKTSLISQSVANDSSSGTVIYDKITVVIRDQAFNRVVIEIDLAIGFNAAPIAVDDSTAMASGDVLNINVLSNDSDADGDGIQLVSAKAENGIVLAKPNGELSYQPNPLFNGVEVIEYLIQDAIGNRSTGRLTVSVEPKIPVSVTNRAGAGGGSMGAGLLLLALVLVWRGALLQRVQNLGGRRHG